MLDLKRKLASSLAEQLDLQEEEIAKLIEIPPSEELGDYALPCFFLAKKMKRDARSIASELSKELSLPEGFAKMQAVGAYLNFFIDTAFLAKEVLSEIMEKKEKYGASEIGKGKRVMIEYSQPNTNKPLHIGHLRNDSIGMAISNLFEFCGYDVIRANLMNDRGIHICQAMLAYKLFGNNETPESTGMKGDKLVGKYYVLFHQKVKEDPKLNDLARELLRKWEAKDPETLALWKKLRDWVIEGFQQTYKIFGSKFDVIFFESDFYYKVKPIIEEGLAKGVFYKNDKGAIVAKLAPLPDKVVLREDGTSIYISNDLVLTKHKIEHYDLDLNIFVVASEQDLYFKQLFRIFELLGYEWYNKNEHLSYGLVLLREGKLKSREGKVIDADDLIASVTELAKQEILKRTELSGKELEERALAIALAAIKFAMLRVDPKKNILFEPEKSISFEGSTGPYIQYTYARARSILRKANSLGITYADADPTLLTNDMEKSIVKKLFFFPRVVLSSLEERKPNLICNYLIELAELFNSYYHEVPVLKAKEDVRKARLLLVDSVGRVIANGLTLLNIPVLEEM